MRLRNVVGLCLLALAVTTPGTSHAKGFHSVYSVDGTDVWAVGDTGSVYRSLNGGTSWGYTPLWNKTLRGVAARALNVVTVGDSGRIWRSANSGGAWNAYAVAGAPSLRGVAMPSEQVVYVVGAGGLILKSLDGGDTWNPQASGTGNTLNAVRFTDVDNGWTVGDAGTVLRTADGGDTWLPVDVTCTTPLYGVDVNGATIWVVGAKAVARRSTNNGASWTMMNLHTDAQPDVRAVWLKTPNTVFLAGGGGFLRRSLDGGHSWLFPKHGMQAQISSLWFAGSKAWACSNGNLSVLVSPDQDTTWAFPAGTTISRTWSQRLPFAGNVRGSTISVNPLNRDVIYCALAGTIYRSPDAGDTWTAMSTITGYTGYANNAMVVYPRDSSRISVAVASSPRRVVMTTQAGAPNTWFTTWSQPTGFGNYGIPLEQDPDHPDTVYFGGDSDGLYRSIDGGFSYQRISSNTFRSPCDIISVPDSSNIILVGDGVTSMDHGVLWKSTDGGQTFSVTDTCDAASEIPGMSNGRLRNNVAFATNWGSGGVWRSKDYGSTWQSISLVGSSWGTDVAKDDPNCMIFGAYGGTLVYLSLDGGDTFINTTLSSVGVANYGFYLRDRGTLLAEESNGIWKMQIGYSYTPSNPQSVTVNAPNGGEVWEAGSTHNVTWTAQGMALARIEYRKTAADP